MKHYSLRDYTSSKFWCQTISRFFFHFLPHLKINHLTKCNTSFLDSYILVIWLYSYQYTEPQFHETRMSQFLSFFASLITIQVSYHTPMRKILSREEREKKWFSYHLPTTRSLSCTLLDVLNIETHMDIFFSKIIPNRLYHPHTHSSVMIWFKYIVFFNIHIWNCILFILYLTISNYEA